MVEDGRGEGGDRAGEDQVVSDGGESAGGRADELDLPDWVFDVVARPAEGRHRLPSLLGLLDGEDARTRLVAATAACLVAESDADMLGYLVERLVDRLDGDAAPAVGYALDYLAARHPEAVEATLDESDDADARRARRRLSRSGTGFARSEYLAPTGGSRPVGRTRVAGGSPSEDPRRTYVREGDERDLPDPSESDEEGDEAEEREDDGDGDASTPASVGVVGREDPGRGVTSGTLRLVSERLAAVVDRSRFDDLAVLDERRRGRYGDVYRTAGAVDGEERAVALTVYRLPETDKRAFVAGFRAAMADWAEVDDHGSVLSVYDWGVRPRPWAALDYTDATLADRADPPGDPLWTTVGLVEAVAHAHRHGAVHGAVDPGNVAYRDTALTDAASRPPLLANVGLAAATGTARPGRGVDPRYAAPEHYADRFGRVDHASDVYGIGAVLYRLCTGRHPYEGDPETVRERVLTDGAPEPAPTAVDPDLPAALDKVVRKATATRKLKRYETVTNLARELRTIRDGA